MLVCMKKDGEKRETGTKLLVSWAATMEFRANLCTDPEERIDRWVLKVKQPANNNSKNNKVTCYATMIQSQPPHTHHLYLKHHKPYSLKKMFMEGFVLLACETQMWIKYGKNCKNIKTWGQGMGAQRIKSWAGQRCVSISRQNKIVVCGCVLWYCAIGHYVLSGHYSAMTAFSGLIVKKI